MQIRYIWQSDISIAIAHCDPFIEDNRKQLHYLDPSVILIDVCESSNNPTGVLWDTFRRNAAAQRGTFTRIAAMILSPFADTMVIDVDITFLQSPDYFFDIPQYKEKKALYFRARIHRESKSSAASTQDLLDKFNQQGVKTDEESAARMSKETGINFFWEFVARNDTEDLPFTQQDAAIVMIHKPSHPNTIRILKEMIDVQHHLKYRHGFCFEDHFWIANTMAKEPYTFEPFSSGQYGDCWGVPVHYDPTHAATYANTNDGAKSHVKPTPLWTSYEKPSVLGQFIGDPVTDPVLVTEGGKDIHPHGSMKTWSTAPGVKTPRLHKICSCGVLNCTSTDVPAQQTDPVEGSRKFGIQDLMILNQWLRFEKHEECIKTTSKSAPSLQYNALRVLQQIGSLAGSDTGKTSESALRVGKGEGINLMNEHIGKVCWFVGCPESTLIKTIATTSVRSIANNTAKPEDMHCLRFVNALHPEVAKPDAQHSMQRSLQLSIYVSKINSSDGKNADRFLKVLPETSKCYNMINYSVSVDDIALKIQRRKEQGGFYTDLHTGKNPVEGVNAGSGTTGTTELSDYLYDAYTYHEQHFTRGAFNFHKLMTGCLDPVYQAQNTTDRNRCTAVNIYYMLVKTVSFDIHQHKFLADYPVPQTFVDIKLAYPQISALMSFREIDEFLVKREKRQDIVCRLDLWDHPDVLHPFDYAGCLKTVKDKTPLSELMIMTEPFHNELKDAKLTPDGRTGYELLKDAYQRMNSVNLIAAHLLTENPIDSHQSRSDEGGQPQDTIIPVCLWDFAREDARKSVLRLLRDRVSDEFLPYLYSRCSRSVKLSWCALDP